MQIKRLKEFQPVQLTLESEEEVKILMTLVGNVSGGTSNFSLTTGRIYNGLRELGFKEYKHKNDTFYGSPEYIKE